MFSEMDSVRMEAVVVQFEVLNSNFQSPGRDLGSVSPEYEARMLMLSI
jgi:hypothetical protein